MIHTSIMFEGYDIYALAPSPVVKSNPPSTRQGHTLTSTMKAIIDGRR